MFKYHLFISESIHSKSVISIYLHILQNIKQVEGLNHISLTHFQSHL